MKLFVYYFASVVFSFGVDVLTVLKLIKTSADNGYLFNYEAIKKFRNLMQHNEYFYNLMNQNYLFYFLPVFNLFYTLQKIVTYESQKEEFFLELGFNNFLVEMTELEKQEYQKHPTLIKAILLMSKPDDDLKKEVNTMNYSHNNTNDSINNFLNQKRELLKKKKAIYLKTLNELKNSLLSSQSKDDKLDDEDIKTLKK